MTSNFEVFEVKKQEGIRLKEEIEEERRKYPSCNSRWTPQTGAIVW
jgi:hypothetical protein